MAAINSNHAMNKLSGQLEDATDPINYLELVRSHPQMDWSTFFSFLIYVQRWSRYQELDSDASWERYRRTQQCVVDMAKFLRFYPKLVFGLNVFLPHGQRLECSITAVQEVRFFVLIDSSGARILDTSSPIAPKEFTDRSLRETIIFENSWALFLKDNSDRDWLTCVSELLKYILDDVSTDIVCRTRAYRCLRELGILPLSTLIHHKHSGPRLKKVAGGGYTDIYKSRIGKTWVCIRVLKPKKDPENMVKKFCTEAFVWSRLRHPNILPFLGASIDLLDPEELCFVTPWIANGNLMDYLKAYPHHDRYTSVCEIVEGIKYLHELDPPVAHRDIKGSNVLVRDDGVCQLADFGLSSIEEDPQLVLSSPGFKGTLYWAAPEVILSSNSGERHHRPADIYALGCTIYEIYTGMPPFFDRKPLELLKLVCLDGRRPDFPRAGNSSEQMRSLWWLIEQCWLEDPTSRPTVILVKNFLRDIGDFKGLPVDQPRLPSNDDKVIQKHSEGILHQIKIWLEQELKLQGYFSPSQSTLVDVSFETAEEETTYLKPAEDLDYPMQIKQTSRQPLAPLYLNDRGVMAFTANQLAPYANLHGLFTPNTPFTQLEPPSLPREYQTTPGLPLTSSPQTASMPLLGPLSLLTPPSTPFRLREHQQQSIANISKSPMTALRVEAQIFGAQRNPSPPLRFDNPRPLPKPPVSPSSSIPYYRRPPSTKARMVLKTDANASPSLYQSPAVPKSRLHTLVTSGHRDMKSTGPRTYASLPSYCPSRLSECTPSIGQPAYPNVSTSREQRFPENATISSVLEGNSEPPIQRTFLRPNQPLGLSPVPSSIVNAQDDTDDEHQTPRFRCED